MTRSTITAGGAGVAFGALITTWAYAQDDLYGLTVGVTVTLMGAIAAATGLVCWHIRQPNDTVDEAFELGRQVGYDRGYLEGRRTARPVVVPLNREGDDGGVTQTAEREVAGHRPRP